MEKNKKGRKSRKIDPTIYLPRLNKLRFSHNDKKAVAAIFAESVDYVHHYWFYRSRKMAVIMEQKIRQVPGNHFSAEQEKTIFLQFNYTKLRMCQIRRQLLGQKEWDKKTVRELLWLNKKQLEYRSKIVAANMGLVLAMAKQSRLPGVEFNNLVSEGSMALLRAVEHFDCFLGYKFSTYAYRVIRRGFLRAAKTAYRYRSRFPNQLDSKFERNLSTELQNQEKKRNLYRRRSNGCDKHCFSKKHG